MLIKGLHLSGNVSFCNMPSLLFLPQRPKKPFKHCLEFGKRVTLPRFFKERCQSGRSGRSRKPLNCVSGFQGSNPCLSAQNIGNQALRCLISFFYCTPQAKTKVPYPLTIKELQSLQPRQTRPRSPEVLVTSTPAMSPLVCPF